MRSHARGPRLIGWMFMLATTGCANAFAASPVVVERLLPEACPETCITGSSYDEDRHAVGATRLYFTIVNNGDDRLWVITSAGAGLMRLADVPPRQLYAVGDALWFMGYTPAMGDWTQSWRLWHSDGTTAGTQPVDLPIPMPKFTDDHFYPTTRGVLIYALGAEAMFWVPADRSMAARKLVDSLLIGKPVEANGVVYFAAGNCIRCAGDQTPRMYRFDPPDRVSVLGTLTQVVNSSNLPDPIDLAATDAGVFYVQKQTELWFSNGSSAPALLHTWPAAADSTRRLSLSSSRAVDERLFFQAADENGRYQLWSSDGTAAGTRQLTHFSLSGFGSGVSLFGVQNDLVILQVGSLCTAQPYRDVPCYPDYVQLWALDAAQPLGARPVHAFPVNGAMAGLPQPTSRGLMFQTQPSDGSGVPVWFTDGRAGGTVRIAPADLGSLYVEDLLGEIDGSVYVFGGESGGSYGSTALYRITLAPGYPATHESVDVTEYYHAGFDHYFMTADPAEKAALDNGTFAGWQRTGNGFAAYRAGSGAAGTSPVCRFYGRPEAGLDSHFYSALPAECVAVAERFGQAWVLESADVFEVEIPDSITGLCSDSTVPLYRAYDNRRDANHRYSVTAQLQKTMQTSGWIPEGGTSAGIAMCVPAVLHP